MVVVSDSELLERVRHLLYECDDEAYLLYLRTYCSDIEGHFDGRAITRLRERLVDVMNGRGSVARACNS